MNTIQYLHNDELISPYEQQYHNTIQQLENTFIKKNRDYGSAVKKNYDNFETYGYKEGLKYVVGRIAEKYQRLTNLTFSSNKPNVQDESIEDTLLDMANYCILATISFNEHKIQNIDAIKNIKSIYDNKTQ